MRNELTNLLPQSRQRALAREYIVHLCATAALLGAALTLAAAVLLVPAYAFLGASVRAKEARLATITSELSVSDESALSSRLTELTDRVKKLSALAQAPSASATLRAILAANRTGITLTDITYTAPPAPGAGGAVLSYTVSGTARSREALRGYELALKALPFVRSADLPVSSYAKDTDIPFTIALTIAP